jgi:hypothetical protein
MKKITSFIIFLIAIFIIWIDLPEKISFGKLNITIPKREISFNLFGIKFKKEFKTYFGLDLKGGAHLVFEANTNKIKSEDVEDALNATRDIIEKRINFFGVSEPQIQTVKSGNIYRISVNLPGVTDINQAINLIGKTAQLSFKELASPSAKIATNSPLLAQLTKETGLTGKDIKKAQVSFESNTGKPQVALEFTTNGNKVYLHSPILNSININRATKTGNWANPVNSSTTNISINSNNSNLKPFIENLPNYLGYSGKILVNPNGNLSATNDFAYYNTGIRIFADIDVPLIFRADYFRLQDVLDINFENVKQLNNVNEGRIIFNVTNNYPFKAKLQAYLLDENNNTLDSLLLSSNNTIQMASVNANNDIIAPKNSQLIAYMNDSTLDHLKKSKKIKLVSYFYLPPSPPDVVIYDDYFLDVVITIDVNYRTFANN